MSGQQQSTPLRLRQSNVAPQLMMQLSTIFAISLWQGVCTLRKKFGQENSLGPSPRKMFVSWHSRQYYNHMYSVRKVVDCTADDMHTVHTYIHSCYGCVYSTLFKYHGRTGVWVYVRHAQRRQEEQPASLYIHRSVVEAHHFGHTYNWCGDAKHTKTIPDSTNIPLRRAA